MNIIALLLRNLAITADLKSNFELIWRNVGKDPEEFINDRRMQTYIESLNRSDRPIVSTQEIVKAINDATDRQIKLILEGNKWILKPSVMRRELAPVLRCAGIADYLRKLALDLTILGGFAKALQDFLKDFNQKNRHPQKTPVEELSVPALDLGTKWVGKGLSSDKFDEYEKIIKRHEDKKDTLGLLNYLTNFVLKASGRGVEKEK